MHEKWSTLTAASIECLHFFFFIVRSVIIIRFFFLFLVFSLAWEDARNWRKIKKKWDLNYKSREFGTFKHFMCTAAAQKNSSTHSTPHNHIHNYKSFICGNWTTIKNKNKKLKGLISWSSSITWSRATFNFIKNKNIWYGSVHQIAHYTGIQIVRTAQLPRVHCCGIVHKDAAAHSTQ